MHICKCILCIYTFKYIYIYIYISKCIHQVGFTGLFHHPQFFDLVAGWCGQHQETGESYWWWATSSVIVLKFPQLDRCGIVHRADKSTCSRPLVIEQWFIRIRHGDFSSNFSRAILLRYPRDGHFTVSFCELEAMARRNRWIAWCLNKGNGDFP